MTRFHIYLAVGLGCVAYLYWTAPILALLVIGVSLSIVMFRFLLWFSPLAAIFVVAFLWSLGSK